MYALYIIVQVLGYHMDTLAEAMRSLSTVVSYSSLWEAPSGDRVIDHGCLMHCLISAT